MLSMTGCKKFIDVNQNVNALTTAPAEQVFSGALAGTYDMQVSSNVNVTPGTWAGIYAHSTSFTGGGAEKTYDYTAANFNAFTGLYDNLNDYEYVKRNASGRTAFIAVPADVMQCYVFQMLVDLYGDVPYTQALKGVANTTPKYDDAQTIYTDLVKRLDTSIAQMARTTWPQDASLTRTDVMFNLDKDKWIRFANTLKLRLLIRQSNIASRQTYITTEINNTLNRGFLESNAQIQPGYSNTAGKLNRFYSTYGLNEVGAVPSDNSNYNFRKMNAVIINWLKTSITTTPPTRPSTTTPSANASADTFRLQQLAAPRGLVPGDRPTPEAPNNYVGVPMGVTSGFANAASSSIGGFVITPFESDRPGYLMLAAESYFLQAEAALRYGITFNGMNDKALYEAGITAHFRTLADPYSDASTSNEGDMYANWYYNRTTPLSRVDNINYDLSVSKLRAIGIQKWVSLVHINGLEAWSEYRRTNGFPTQVNVPQSPQTTDPSVVNPEPARYLIPQIERNTNAGNVPQNQDRFAKLFWDVN